jgi:hypothetical protein
LRSLYSSLGDAEAELLTVDSKAARWFWSIALGACLLLAAAAATATLMFIL